MTMNAKDVKILRDIALRYMEIARSDENKALKSEWVRFNAKKSQRPLLIVNEIPWQEIDLALKCETPFCRQIEAFLKQNLWIKNNLKTDFVLDDYIKLPISIIGCDFSLTSKGKSRDAKSNVFEDLLESEDDIEKLKPQPIYVDRQKTEENLNIYNDIFGDTIPIKQSGRTVLFNAWDLLETWHGVENCLMDLYDRPEFLHAIMRRITDITHHVIDSLDALKLIDDEQESLCYSLLYNEKHGERGTAKNSWVFGTAQIFSSVSKEMHEEFELPYVKEIFARFGYGYYGCCEPLHDRIDMVDKIPNVKKVSISPFANAKIGAENIGDKYIMSRKPTPSYLGTSSVNWDVIENEIIETLTACRHNGVTVEFILKDLTTINSNPNRLKEWSERVYSIING